MGKGIIAYAGVHNINKKKILIKICKALKPPTEKIFTSGKQGTNPSETAH